MRYLKLYCLSFIFMFLFIHYGFAQNPIIRGMFSADPTARVFGDSVYLYSSHDILANENRGRIGWFCMEDYHVFSSVNLTQWKDDGIVVTQNKVPWVKPDSYSMWAPDCVERNGKYYFYFPSAPKDTTQFGKGFAIGVAIADKPTGPFVPQAEPLTGVHGIDPNVLIDKDGQAYIYYAMGNLYVAKLKENMLELDSEPQIIANLPEKGLKEGPFPFERNGIYYLTYPHVADKTERLEYAISNSPTGPFKVAGVIMDATPECWTNHQSVMEYKGQWYLFYHHNDYSPNFDKARSVRADSLFFNEDGTIRKVFPTLRGIGVTDAADTIQVDRYSTKSEDVSVEFIDTANKFAGWKTKFSKPSAWIQYNTVDFRKQKLKTAFIRAKSATGGTLQIHQDDVSGPVIASVKVSKGEDWKVIKASLSGIASGIHNIVVAMKDNGDIELDWLSFK